MVSFLGGVVKNMSPSRESSLWLIMNFIGFQMCQIDGGSQKHRVYELCVCGGLLADSSGLAVGREDSCDCTLADQQGLGAYIDLTQLIINTWPS